MKMGRATEAEALMATTAQGARDLVLNLTKIRQTESLLTTPLMTIHPLSDYEWNVNWDRTRVLNHIILATVFYNY